MSSASNAYLGDIERWFVKQIQQAAADATLSLRSRVYAGDINTEDSLNAVISECGHQPLALVGIESRLSAKVSTDPRLRDETIQVNVYVAATNHRSQEDVMLACHPIISVVEGALVGRSDMSVADPAIVKVTREIDGGSFTRLFDEPGFIMLQMPFTIGTLRRL